MIVFGKTSYVFRNNDIPINLKTNVIDTCLLLVATYGLETMAMTKKTANHLSVMQKAMERAMLTIILKDRKRNEETRQKTKFVDFIE